jgi:hypothetical protein
VQLSEVAYSPQSVAVGETKQIFTVAAGAVIIAGALWVDQGTDVGSTGTLTITGDSQSMFTLNLAPTSDAYGPGQSQGIRFSRGTGWEINQGAETVSILWTPGGSPGVTPPKIRIGVLTEQFF